MENAATVARQGFRWRSVAAHFHATPLLLASALIPALYFLILRFAFPGYFTPFAPHHPDLFNFEVFAGRPLREVITYPRPLLFVVSRLFGLMGYYGALSAVILIALSQVLLTVFFVGRWSGQRASSVLVAGYILLVLAHPEFYFEHRHDLPAELSYIFLLISVDLWRGWLKDGRSKALIGCLFVLLLLGLTKETYLVALGILFVGMIFLVPDVNRRRRGFAGLGGALAVLSLALYVSFLGYAHWVAPVTGADPTYKPYLSPASLISVWWLYFRTAMSWSIALVVASALAFVLRDGKQLYLALLLISAATASLVPNSTLPHHVFEEYAWVAVPLLLSPLLLIPARWQPVLITSCLVGLCFGNYRHLYQSPGLQWQVRQEKINRNIMASFAQLKQRLDAGTRKILIVGVDAPLAPFLMPEFIDQEFGRRAWTILVRRDAPEQRNANVSQAHANHVDPEAFDEEVVYNSAGEMVALLNREELRKRIAVDPAAALIPELDSLLNRLRNQPNDFMTLLSAGSILLDWGAYDRAVPLLTRAVSASGGKNAYPYFFLGQCAEAQGNRGQAKLNYQRAVDVSEPPANPLFKEALNRVSKAS